MEIKCTYKELVDASLLTPNPRNPNKHGDRQIELLAKIIGHTGFRHPIVVSNRSGFIVAGHGRLQAANKLGLDKVPVDYQDFKNEAEEFEFLIADNKIAELADHDDNMMIEGIKELDLTDLELLGLDNFELPLEPEPAQCDEDEVPENVDTRCKLGDVWLLGEHRLLCGDATDVLCVEKLMDGAKADMVFTDPPYNHASSEKLIAQSVRKAMKKLSNSEWDKDFDIKTALGSIDSAKAESCTVYICTSWHLAGDIWEWMKEHSTHYSYCVWSKNNPMPSLAKRHWTWSSELICYATYGKHIFNFPKEGHAKSVWEFNKNAKNDLHPTMKPVELCEHSIAHSSNIGSKVLDLFGGSGSTLIACEKTNRKCYMMEIDPHYCDVILSRWEKYTGKEAKLDGRA